MNIKWAHVNDEELINRVVEFCKKNNIDKVKDYQNENKNLPSIFTLYKRGITWSCIVDALKEKYNIEVVKYRKAC